MLLGIADLRLLRTTLRKPLTMQEIRIDELITVSNGQSNVVVDLSTRRKSTFTNAPPLIEEFLNHFFLEFKYEN